MNFKQLTAKLIIATCAFTLFSCDDDDDNVVTIDPSADAQIYSFALKAEARTQMDSIAFPILEKTRWTIDQKSGLIYNSDSLPYRTRRTNYAMSITYALNTRPGKITLRYAGIDSTWNGADSVDFKKLERIKVLAEDGINSKTYFINLNIHKIDPDIIPWTAFTPLNKTPDQIKTLPLNDLFLCLYTDAGVIGLGEFNSTTSTWADKTVTGLPTTVKIESFNLLNNTFYVVGNDGSVYSSTDAETWNNLGNKDIHNILGVLTDENASKDYLLMTQSISGNYKLVRSEDISTSIDVLDIIGTHDNLITKSFLADKFTSSSTANSLIVTGGRDFNNKLKNTSWSISFRDNKVEMLETNKSNANTVINANENIATFHYDKKLYALNDSIFATSNNSGYKWVVESQKQTLPEELKHGLGQSVVVDGDNFIWLFGKEKSQNKLGVWKGRLNRLNPSI